MARSAPYSKRRFYELVKLYHPDTYSSETNAHTGERLTQGAKLERYRMVIAANELLSSPSKRRLYDTTGHGWSGTPEFGPSKPRWADANDVKWSGFDDNVNEDRHGVKNNATWEDWERWYMRDQRTKGPQRPTYVSNNAFVLLIVTLAAVGAGAEGLRVGNHSKSVIDQVEERHDRSSKELMRKRRETRDISNREESVQNFLRARGPEGLYIPGDSGGRYEDEGEVFVPDKGD